MAKQKKVKQLKELKKFEVFATFVFKNCFGFDLSEVQIEMCRYLGGLDPQEDGLRRGQLSAMRGCGKSVLTATYAVWRLYWEPDLKVMALSATAQRAEEMVALCRQIMEHELFKHMRPRLGSEGSPTGKDQADSRLIMDCGHLTKLSKEPSMQAKGITANITGAHPDLIIYDDIEVPETGGTAAKREKLIKKVHEGESLIQPKGTIIFLGTPHSMESIYNKLQNTYPQCRFPAEYPDPEDQVASAYVSTWMLDKVKADTSLIGLPTYPERFNEVALQKKKEAYGEATYALQMLLNCSLADANRYPLRFSDLMVMKINPEETSDRVVWADSKAAKLKIGHCGLDDDYFTAPAFTSPSYMPYERRIMTIDPSGAGSDETSYSVCYSAAGMVYVQAVGGFGNGHSDGTLRELAKVAAKYQVNEIYIETNFGDGLFEKVFMPVVAEHCGPVKIKGVRNQAQKEQRILDILEPTSQTHRLVVDEKVAIDPKFQDQYAHITRARGSLKHDDRIDVVAMGVQVLSYVLQQDLDDAAAEAAYKEQVEQVKLWEADFRNPERHHQNSLYMNGGRTRNNRPSAFGNSNKGGWSNSSKRKRNGW